MGASNVKWVRLGDYIEQCNERNHNNKYDIEAIKGISTNKTFIDTMCWSKSIQIRPLFLG